MAVQTSVISVSTVSCQTCSEDEAMDIGISLLNQLPMGSLLKVISEFLSKYGTSEGISVPNDFLPLVIKAMIQLKRNYRANVVYNFVKGLGTIRLDGSDSRFPAKMMPMGLVEYVTNFFVADTVQQVSMLEFMLAFFRCCFCLRCHRALLIITCGSRPCTFSSVKNGLSSIMDLYGVWPQLVRVKRDLHHAT